MMNDFIEKLNVKTTDYVAVIDANKRTASELGDVAKGLVCVGKTNLPDIRYVESVFDLEESAFDKVLVYCHERVHILFRELIRITDHFGMVLLCNVSPLDCEIAKGGFKKLGIFECWQLENEQKISFDLLLKIRK